MRTVCSHFFPLVKGPSTNHPCLFVIPKSWHLRTSDSWGRQYLGFSIRPVGPVISLKEGILPSGSHLVSLDLVSVEKFFLGPNCLAFWGVMQDLNRITRSHLTSVGCFLCFKHVPQIIKSSCQPAKVLQRDEETSPGRTVSGNNQNQTQALIS